MKHYEKRLEQDEERIRSRIAAVASQVRDALKNSVHALLTGNRKLANMTVLGDGGINREVRAIDRDCHHFIVRHLPSAGHLRQMSATIRSAIALERIGDYAVNIARAASRLSTPPDKTLAAVVEHMADESGEMLERAVQALADLNAEQAKAIMAMAQQVERLRATALDDLTSAKKELSIDDLFAMFVVFANLERVADQAKNLCEEAVFAATGQGKAKKGLPHTVPRSGQRQLGPDGRSDRAEEFSEQRGIRECRNGAGCGACSRHARIHGRSRDRCQRHEAAYLRQGAGRAGRVSRDHQPAGADQRVRARSPVHLEHCIARMGPGAVAR
jgi:phosphate transport system protein